MSGNDPTVSDQSNIVAPSLPTARSFSRKFRSTRIDTKNRLTSTGSFSTAATSNPFGDSAQFLEVAYLDQINHVPPPVISVQSFLPSSANVASEGLTIECWFLAESSGILVAQPMGVEGETSGAVGLAPLIYIDSDGRLCGGLFDATPLTLLSPPQNLIATQGAYGLVAVGPLNALATPLSVVDGEWHHAALVVQPGVNGSQTLFLDGRLAATATSASGSFGFSFVTNTGTEWDQKTNAQTQFGGSITPQPQTLPSPNFLPYTQGFTGCLNELRCWSGPRTATQIQQFMAQPLGPDLSTYQQQGLFGYAGSSELQTAAELTPGAYLSMVADAPPFDTFTDVNNRIPGYQNFGVFNAIPFTTVALEVTFQPFQANSTKINLWRADNLQVSFPGQNSDGDNLTGTFAMRLTGAATGQIQVVYEIAPNSVYTIIAPLTDCYRLDFTYFTPFAPTTIDNLQFMLIPGPSNTLMQLLLDIQPGQTAYTDPNYPIAETLVTDPRNPQDSVTLYPYWPLFTDQTVFPIAADANYTADDLLAAYLNFNAAARKGSLASGATFSDFFSLSANDATISEVGDLNSLLNFAYNLVTGNEPPAVPPSAPFDSANDQIYAFINNANSLRQTLSTFLNSYQGWAQTTINDLALANIPSGVANQIYNGQEQVEATLKGPSSGEFILNLLISSALWGLGGVLASLVLGPEAAVAAVIAVGFIGGAGANALSEIIGAFLSSSSVRAKLTSVSYSTLEEVANAVQSDMASAYKTILDYLLDPAYAQTLYSNYGLLQALSFINAQPLYDDKTAIAPGQEDPLTIGTAYASWEALIPSVFTWTAKQIGGEDDLTTLPNVFMMGKMEHFLFLPLEPIPTQISIYDVLENNLDVLYQMFVDVQDWQTAKKSPPKDGQFFTICPIFFGSSDQPAWMTAVWVIIWSLKDQKNNSISPDTAAQLFGFGETGTTLLPVDQNNPIAPAGYGWYWHMANAAVTTPFDAFMNWGEGVPSYSPQILVSQWQQQYAAFFGSGNVAFSAAAASDIPVAAVVTLVPGVLVFGEQTVGSTNTISAVLANNQKDKLTKIAVQSNSVGVFTVAAVPTELMAGDTATIDISFSPVSAGYVSDEITVSAKGEYGPISLTLQVSGTGFEPPPTVNPGNIILQGDPSVWNEVQFYLFDNYADALANWSTGENSVGVAQLIGQGAQCTGLPSAWLAGSGIGSEPQFFMIIYFCNDIVLQFVADGNQAGAVVQGSSLPPNEGGGGSITWQGSPAWNEGVTYYVFSSLEDALKNWTTGENSIASGQLPAGGGTDTGVPSGWLAVSGDNQGTVQPYVILQYFDDVSLVLCPYNAQAVVYGS